jgi:transposase-like protein
LKVQGRWVYLYRAIDCSGALVDVMLSDTRDMAAAKAFFRSAKMVTGITPTRVITDGHDSYPRAIRTELGRHVRHRTSRYLTNRLEQDHRGIKGRYRPMQGLQCVGSAARFCRGYDELRNFLRPAHPSITLFPPVAAGRTFSVAPLPHSAFCRRRSGHFGPLRPRCRLYLVARMLTR